MGGMEEMGRRLAHYLSIAVETIAALVILIALVQFLYAYVRSRLRPQHHIGNAWLRVNFGSNLTIALELLLAADILQTAIAPSWDEIGKLGAIATIRTGLNYFLEKELDNLEKRVASGQPEENIQP